MDKARFFLRDLKDAISQIERYTEGVRNFIKTKINEDFAGAYPKHKREKFDKKRQKQSEVLGYKLMGKSDIRSEIGDATVKEARDLANRIINRNKKVLRSRRKK